MQWPHENLSSFMVKSHLPSSKDRFVIFSVVLSNLTWIRVAGINMLRLTTVRLLNLSSIMFLHNQWWMDYINNRCAVQMGTYHGWPKCTIQFSIIMEMVMCKSKNLHVTNSPSLWQAITLHYVGGDELGIMTLSEMG